MNGALVSAVSAYTAHREWATRPPDERYSSVTALYDAARARRERIEARAITRDDLQDRGRRRRCARASTTHPASASA
jgi:acyl-CoA reductase-like NAD-dependent aldehyde dehydrogenase